jgi:hypothetical protein
MATQLAAEKGTAMCSEIVLHDGRGDRLSVFEMRLRYGDVARVAASEAISERRSEMRTVSASTEGAPEGAR